ncbi:MAG: IS3 family transposase [Acidobacteriota bacterium]|nr:IS3 family transposase [Acidobacteriota bacterium]
MGEVDHRVIYRFMDLHQGEHRIATMARVLGVSRSGYYAWKTRPVSSRARTDELLKKEISRVHALHEGAYGAPRIHGELQRQGWKVSRKRVARLMRELGIHGLARGPRRRRG